MSEKDPITGRPYEGEGETVLERAPKTKKPKKYKVIFHNDDYTTMEFVVHVLMKFFHKSRSEATFIMLTVHQKGAGVAGVYPRDQAETKVEQVTRYAREHGHPLMLSMEEA
ncbi:MAG: ATP-dependent Clp protease adapter ClpS [Deltaproteobacteria bacterium]|nr:MAG: ATP-dependent Clp protease adapter ClpS [Deltaproteobacteria bacterium]